MAVPVGKNVYVTLVSGDVIHAWYVPHFLFKRDVVPGQTNHFEFTVDEDEAGEVFHGQCAELCGTGHRVMLFDVLAMTPGRLRRLARRAGREGERDPAAAAVRRNRPSSSIAKNIAFDKHELQAPADAPFAITFTNDDPATVTHDIDIRQGPGAPVAPGRAADPGRSVDPVQLRPAARGHLPVLLLRPSRRARDGPGPSR